MDWVFLIAAGLMEIVWAIGLKYTQGFTKLYPSLMTVAAMVLSFYFFSIALKTIPLGTGYAVWVGIGAIGVALVGIFYLGETANLFKIICLCMILLGMAGLKFASALTF